MTVEAATKPAPRACIVGVQSCGCVTYANSRPDDLDRTDEKVFAALIREGGQIVRTTVEEAHQMPHFMPSECPHDPKGWEREQPAKPKLRTKIVRSRQLRVVYLEGRRLGEVRQWDGTWEATRGWFNYRAAGANNGVGDGSQPVKVFRPFATLREAMEALNA